MNEDRPGGEHSPWRAGFVQLGAVRRL